uniref:Uncharacterized protein n=1 Tax=Glossina brevipalpis TaxID=37001 RepID=A0A1A9WV16_9MUSC
MMQHVNDMAQKRLNKNVNCVVVGRTNLAYPLDTYEEILDYLRLCLWYSAGAVCAPVTDPKEVIDYWQILREILDNLTFNEWRVRTACCLAVRDLLKGPNGLRLRSEEKKVKFGAVGGETLDDVPEPELKELWSQLFRVMDVWLSEQLCVGKVLLLKIQRTKCVHTFQYVD